MGYVPTGSGFLVFDIETWVNLAVFAVLLILKIFAFVNSLLYSSESYVAADKLNKATWTIVLGFAVVLQIVPLPIAFVNLVGTVFACVFLVDVRPAIGGLHRR